MSKLPVEEEDLPPPYYSVSAPVATNASAVSDFSARLNDLALQITSAREARSLAREQDVSDARTLVTPYLEGMISSMANMNPVPQVFEMVMVPAQAVGEDWEFSDEDDNRKLVRIEQESPTKLDNDRKRPAGFEDTPESTLWWDDEHMARRLARSLQPRRVTRQVVRQKVEEAKEVKKASRWGLFKKPETPPAAPLPTPTSTATYEEGDDPRMTVLAEEVTFRKENEMGIWESQSGWGLVVTIRLK